MPKPGEAPVTNIKNSLVNADGTTTNATVLSNVGKGKVSENSTDAVNGSQLHEVEKKIDKAVNKLGEGLTFGADNASGKQELGSALTINKGDTSSGYKGDNLETKYEKDANGNVIIQPQFKALSDVETKFSEDRAFVKSNGKVVAIDGKGTVLFNAPSNEVYPYKNGLAEFRRKVSHFGLGGILGLVGMGYLYNHGGVYIEGLGGLVDDGMKRGYIDRNGVVIIDSKNDYVYPMEEHGTLVRNEGKLGFMNRQGQYVIQPGNYEAGTIDMNNVLLTLKNKDTNKYGIFDMETGKQEVPFKYDTIEFVGEHEMSVTNDTNRYVVDMATGRVIYKGDKSINVKAFIGDTYTWVYNKEGNYKILSLDGTVTETPVMKDISGTGSFSHGYSPVKIKGKWGIINSKGELVVQPTYDEITIL